MDGVPTVSRTIFPVADVLQAETKLNVAADHDLGVNLAAGAEARRAAGLHAEITRLQQIYCSCDGAGHSSLSSADAGGTATRRVPVPEWALPWSHYWPIGANDVNHQHIAHVLSLGFAPASPRSAAAAAARSEAADAAALPPHPLSDDNGDHDAPFPTVAVLSLFSSRLPCPLRLFLRLCRRLEIFVTPVFPPLMAWVDSGSPSLGWQVLLCPLRLPPPTPSVVKPTDWVGVLINGAGTHSAVARPVHPGAFGREGLTCKASFSRLTPTDQTGIVWGAPASRSTRWYKISTWACGPSNDASHPT